jgi:abequosyltransferase
MKNNLLSICIITYNRPHLVKNTIEAFISQCSNYNIPIYVSDNSNDLETSLIIQELKLKYKYLYYHLNENNLGFDGNILSVVNLAESKYCWLFGDDDLIEENAIDIVLDKLNLNYGAIFINASTSNSDFSKTISKKHWFLEKNTYYSNDSIREAFKDLILYSSFVGSLVIKRDLWMKVDYIKYFKTGFVHVGIVFEYLIQTDAFYIADPLVKIRLGNSGWSKNSFNIWYVNWVSVINNLPLYSKDLKDKVIRTPDRYNIKFLLAERAKKYYTIDNYNQIIKYSKDISKLNKFIFFLISISPTYIWKNIFKIYLIIKKPFLFEYQLFELELNSKETDYI